MKYFLLVLASSSLIFSSSCSLIQRDKTVNLPADKEKAEIISQTGDNENISLTEQDKKKIPSELNQGQSSHFDQALDFYDTANDFLKSGEYEAALEALDQAYDIIMSADIQNPNDLQQKDDIRLTIAKRILEVHSSRTTKVQGKQSAIQIPDNIYVQKEIARLSGPEKVFFAKAYRRSGKYMDMILAKLKEAGLPEELAWLPLIESGFQVKALSSARALGLWQFIPSTGVRFGLKRDLLVDERMDPEKSTDAAVAYLSELHNLFGDWPTVLAAYNCGEGRVLRTIKSQNINYLDNFWDFYTKLPDETAKYVPRFLASIHIVQNMEKYGFSRTELDKALEFETVSAKRQVSLEDISKSTKIPLEELKELNPELRYSILPKETYSLKIPKGYTDTFLAGIESIKESHPPQRQFLHHRVRQGEALSAIANRYKVPLRRIMQENNIKQANLIRAGAVIKIPTNAMTPPPVNMQSGTASLNYKVKKGDSLWTIAKRFNTTTKSIMAINGLSNSNLQIGQNLKIAGNTQQVKNIKTKKETHYVQTGDTPFTIALKYNIPLKRLLHINKLSPHSTIYPGQELSIE